MEPRPNTYWNSYLPVFFDRMSSHMRAHMTSVVQDYGLTSAHAIYLIALEIGGPMSQKELSRFLDLDVANTNRVIKVLREKGMVCSEDPGAGSKNCKMALTRIGSELAVRVMESTDQWMDSLMANVPLEDVMNMRNTLITILKSMDPKLDEYMSSENKSYYYTYLSTTAEKDGWKYHVSNRVDNE